VDRLQTVGAGAGTGHRETRMRIRQVLAALAGRVRPALSRRRIVAGVPAGIAAGVLALLLLRAAAAPALLPTEPYSASPPTAVSGPA
jgi:hypothetical protein